MSEVIIFPTDTVYGIGTKIFDVEGIKRIYEIKHRPLSKPLACLCASLEQIKEIAFVSKDAEILINKFLPGALTLILESKSHVVDKIFYHTIGVRIPNSRVALSILSENGPMLTTSVNESGQVPLNEYDEIKKEYSNLVDKIYPTNQPSSSIASTVVSLLEGKPKILRIGQISEEEIEKALNNV